MKRYCLVVIFFNLHLVSQSSSQLQRNIKGNLFHKVNDDVQNTFNKVFELLKLNKNCTSLRKNRLLLTMRATMKSIAENNYPRYKDMRRASKLFVKKKRKNVLFNLDKLINILVQEKLAPGNFKIFSDPNYKTGINFQLTSLEIPENEEETFAYLREYLNNVDGNYIDSPLQKIKNEFEKNSQKVKERRKLKAWKAETTNQTNSRRVFQGKSANIKKYPFLASIHVLGEFVCAGSIINKLMVITAATCLQRVYYEDNKEIITVRVGSDHTNISGTLHSISQVFFHPYYNPETLSNNLAILKIQKELNFKHKTKIRRVDYQRLEGNLDNSVKEVLIVGWGDTNSGYSNGMDQLSYSHLDVYNLQKCIDTYTSKYVNVKNFCAGFASKGAGACQRDIGAPGIVGNVLVGVVSFGPPVCGTVNAPTVFVNLGYYIRWIDSVIREMPLNYATTPLMITQPERMRAYDFATHKSTAKIESKIVSTITEFKTSPVMNSATTEYPQAIKVLTYLLNKLIAPDSNFQEESEEDNNVVKKAPRSDWITNSAGIMQTETPNTNENEENKPTFSTLSYNNILMGMLMKNIGGYFGLNKMLQFSEVNESVPDEETENKFANTDINYTPYRSNVKTEKAIQYTPVSATSILESFPENDIIQYKKKHESSRKKEENNHNPGTIFENTNNDFNDAMPEIKITTQAVIFENTYDPDDFKVSEKPEDFEPKISDNYETENNDGMSIDMPSQVNVPSLKQYKYRTKGYTGPEYKKDYVFDEIISEKMSTDRKINATRKFNKNEVARGENNLKMTINKFENEESVGDNDENDGEEHLNSHTTT